MMKRGSHDPFCRVRGRKPHFWVRPRRPSPAQCRRLLDLRLPALDKQHRDILRLIHLLGASLKIGPGDLGEDILSELIRCIDLHLSYEQKVLTHAGCPTGRGHSSDSDAILRELRTIGERPLPVDRRAVARIRELWLSHIAG